jgi:glycine/D-amino acid oxidase-like deaminating enzyme
VEQPEGLAAMSAMLDRLQAGGLACQLLDAGDLRRMEPNLSPDLAGGAYFPTDGMVNPLFTTQALAQGARMHGARIQTHCEVTGFELAGNGSLAAVRTADERIPTACAVIAAGAWSAVLGRMAGFALPVQPRKGHLVVTAPVPEGLLNCKVILSAGYMDSVHSGAGSAAAVAANVQQVGNGNLLLGSSRQFAGFDLSVDPAVVSEILARCVRFVPALAQTLAIRMWAGLRPYTPDLLPVIGPVGRVPGLYVATGHEGIGITEGPITGALISQMICGQPLELAVERLSPDRFDTMD